MSRKNERDWQDKKIKEAVSNVRQTVQIAYNSGLNIEAAIQAGKQEIKQAIQALPKLECTILYFCEQEIERLAEAMRLSDERIHPKTAKEKWLERREEKRAAAG